MQNITTLNTRVNCKYIDNTEYCMQSTETVKFAISPHKGLSNQIIYSMSFACSKSNSLKVFINWFTLQIMDAIVEQEFSTFLQWLVFPDLLS